MTKGKHSFQDQLWGIGCTILVVVAILTFVYYLTGKDIVAVGIALVVALVAGLYGLLSGKPINN